MCWPLTLICVMCQDPEFVANFFFLERNLYGTCIRQFAWTWSLMESRISLKKSETVKRDVMVDLYSRVDAQFGAGRGRTILY